MYWHNPMVVPGQRFEKPGKSPVMDMQLVPVYADGAGESTGVKVSAGVQQNLGIRYATVRRENVASSFDAIGTVQFDERLSFAVQTRVAGYVERLSVRASMERVRKGQPLATIFAPEWLGPLNELLALRRAGVSEELVAAARDRTRAMSIATELVRQAEKGVAPTGRYILVACLVWNQWSFRHSSRKRPLKLSVQPFCIGRPGWIRMRRMPWLKADPMNVRLVNSGPLSVRTIFG